MEMLIQANNAISFTKKIINKLKYSGAKKEKS